MVKVTSLEKGLKRLLGLCPDITLNPESIQDIIDGKINKVICEARGGTYDDTVYTKPEPVPEPKIRKLKTTQEVGKTPKVVTEDKTEDENISTTIKEASNDFEEYFEK